MPFTMKIQPIDFQVPSEGTKLELVKPVVKSRLKRLLERQFSGVLRNSATDKVSSGGAGEEPHLFKDGFNGCNNDFEPSSVCLAKMVQNFMEENHEKHPSGSVRCGRNRGNCFNGNFDDSSGDESDAFGDTNYSSVESSEILKGLVACASVNERNLLADTAKIIEKNKICKRKDGFCRKIVTEGLLALGYDASICKSRWEKSPSYPSGEYEYIDVVFGKERVIIDIDFRSEFEIARSTKAYKSILQNLPFIFVGKCDRLQSIVTIVSEAGKQSLKKKGMHVPPWRRVEYVKAKWLSPYTRTTPSNTVKEETENTEKEQTLKVGSNGGESEEGDSAVDLDDSVFAMSESSGEDEKVEVKVELQLKPSEMKPKGSSLSGLAAVFENDNP